MQTCRLHVVKIRVYIFGFSYVVTENKEREMTYFLSTKFENCLNSYHSTVKLAFDRYPFNDD